MHYSHICIRGANFLPAKFLSIIDLLAWGGLRSHDLDRSWYAISTRACAIAGPYSYAELHFDYRDNCLIYGISGWRHKYQDIPDKIWIVGNYARARAGQGHQGDHIFQQYTVRGTIIIFRRTKYFVTRPVFSKTGAVSSLGSTFPRKKDAFRRRKNDVSRK